MLIRFQVQPKELCFRVAAHVILIFMADHRWWRDPQQSGFASWASKRAFILSPLKIKNTKISVHFIKIVYLLPVLFNILMKQRK